MATKMNVMKFLQESRGFSEIARPRLPRQKSALFLIQMRSHLAQTSQGRRRLVIKVNLKDQPDIPHPIQIRHLKSTATPENNSSR